MAYDDEKVLSGREPAYILELDVDTCSLVYGNSPCTASGASGTECFNTFGTCQDTPNFAKATKTYRFTSTRMDALQGAGESPAFPTLTSIQTSPTVLTPSKGLGIRSKVTVKLQDHPFTDVTVDPYYDTRSYTPMDQGTFWGKFLARNLYYEGREMRIKTGYLDENGEYVASNFITRTYFIDTITGPDAKGNITIVGKDVLKFTDNVKAQLPTQSQATLSADINSSVTSINISDPQDNVKDAYDGGQTYIRIDDEILNITNISGTNPSYTLTVTRATMPSIYSLANTAEAHSEDATVQDCYFYNDQEIDNIVEHLLGTVTGIDASYLPTSDWQTVIDFGLQNYRFSALIVEPTGVNDLLSEITEHTIFLWWDERAQEVKMDSLINRAQDGGPFNDTDHIVADSVNVARSDKERVSQVWVAHGLRSPILEMDEIKNFESVKVTIDGEAEGANAYDQTRVRQIRSRWVPTSLASVASEISSRLLSYYSTTKKVVTMTMDPKDDAVWTGDLITMATRQIVDEFGSSPELAYRVLQVNESLMMGDVRYKYTMQSTDQDLLRVGLIGPNTLNDYNSESEANKAKYAFIAEDDRGDSQAGFSPDEDPYVIV